MPTLQLRPFGRNFHSIIRIYRSVHCDKLIQTEIKKKIIKTQLFLKISDKENRCSCKALLSTQNSQLKIKQNKN